jgi:hypothetical protein
MRRVAYLLFGQNSRFVFGGLSSPFLGTQMLTLRRCCGLLPKKNLYKKKGDDDRAGQQRLVLPLVFRPRVLWARPPPIQTGTLVASGLILWYLKASYTSSLRPHTVVA